MEDEYLGCVVGEKCADVNDTDYATVTKNCLDNDHCELKIICAEGKWNFTFVDKLVLVTGYVQKENITATEATYHCGGSVDFWTDPRTNNTVGLFRQMI